VLELDNETSIPPAGAGPLIATVPTEACPPVRALGATCREVSAGGRIVRLAVLLTPESVVLIDTLVVADTGDVVMVNAAEVAPAFT
jgi:hypothetical protein